MLNFVHYTLVYISGDKWSTLKSIKEKHYTCSMSCILQHIYTNAYVLGIKNDESRGHEFEGELGVAYGTVWREERGEENIINWQSQNYTTTIKKKMNKNIVLNFKSCSKCK